MNLRKATKKDISELVKLDKLASREIKWWESMSSSEFSKLVRQKLVYLAEDKEIIGYLTAEKKKTSLALENIYIKKGFRKKRVAKKLVRKFISDWKNSKFKEIQLICKLKLKKFYERIGFKSSMILMKKRLK